MHLFSDRCSWSKIRVLRVTCDDESLAHPPPNSPESKSHVLLLLYPCVRSHLLFTIFSNYWHVFTRHSWKKPSSKLPEVPVRFLYNKLVKCGWLVFSSEVAFIKGYHPLSNSLLWDTLIIWSFKIKKQNDALMDLLYNYTKRLWNLTASITLSCVTLRKITRHPGCVHFVIVKRKEEKRH